MFGNLFENLLVVFVLGGLGVLVYCKLMNKTILDFIRELRTGFMEDIEE